MRTLPDKIDRNKIEMDCSFKTAKMSVANHKMIDQSKKLS